MLYENPVGVSSCLPVTFLSIRATNGKLKIWKLIISLTNSLTILPCFAYKCSARRRYKKGNDNYYRNNLCLLDDKKSFRSRVNYNVIKLKTYFISLIAFVYLSEILMRMRNVKLFTTKDSFYEIYQRNVDKIS